MTAISSWSLKEYWSVHLVQAIIAPIKKKHQERSTMKRKAIILFTAICSLPLIAATDSGQDLHRDVRRLEQQTRALQAQLSQLQKQLIKQSETKKTKHVAKKRVKRKHQLAEKHAHSVKKSKNHATHGHEKSPKRQHYHSSIVSVHSFNKDPESVEFYPTALVADNHVATFIAGTPIVTAPYLGARPAFDGSDYIVNISSINRDVRLMQQRRQLYEAYAEIGYPRPTVPILALSGKVEPIASLGGPFNGPTVGDVTLGTGELDTAAILNDNVEGYLSLAFDESQPAIMAGQRLANTRVGFNMGFVNIGNLDKTPIYFTAGQLYAPFGRYSSSMISPPLTMILARTKTRPVILGYRSQEDTGPFAAIYGFSGDTTYGGRGVGGFNVGYNFNTGKVNGEIGFSGISAINNSGGMQFTGSPIGTTFGGFASLTNGSEYVHQVPALGVHGDIRFSRYNLIAEWVGVSSPFRAHDLSFNGKGALPQAAQLEGGVTFKVWDKPATVALGYQWSQQTLALNLPNQRFSGVFNISIWRDTVESIEYRHDIDFRKNQYANGAAPTGLVNANTVSSGGSTDTLLAQIGVYF